jgi:hypothetical protein
MSINSPMDPADPAYARKLSRDLVTWSRSPGYAPHRDRAKVEPLFGTVDAAACDVEFRFGPEGRPVLMAAISAEDMSEAEDFLIEAESEAADWYGRCLAVVLAAYVPPPVTRHADCRVSGACPNSSARLRPRPWPFGVPCRILVRKRPRWSALEIPFFKNASS